MLRYRLLLVDTEKDYRRPVQIIINDLRNAETWIVGVLRSASETAYVQIYEALEHELGTYKHSDIDYDKGTIPCLQPAAAQADQLR